MSLVQPHLPPLDFDNGGLHIMLEPSDDVASTVSGRTPSIPSVHELDDGAANFADPQPADQTIPTHPIPVMQEAFAESLEEVTGDGISRKPKLRELDAKGRRDRLLEQPGSEPPFDATWRLRPGQKQHEVLKLVAQISFGVYLMLNGMANSHSQVVEILQGHIDEVDEFLEVALEDLEQASKDLTSRIDYLKLPMANMRTFEELLEDRSFRAEILEGNEKIEHIITRTNAAMKQWEADIEIGLNCSTVFGVWLKSLENKSWTKEHPDLRSIFDAMKGNADGWSSAFEEMNNRTQHVNSRVFDLTTIVTEIEQKVGEVSRKNWSTIKPFSSPVGSSRTSMSSPTSRPKTRSTTRASTRASVRTGSTVQQHKSDAPSSQPLGTPFADDGFDAFALPGAATLLPPSRKKTQDEATASPQSPEQSKDGSEKKSPPSERVEPAEEEPLYLLQPRTYTPQPPEPLPSPLVIKPPSVPPMGGFHPLALQPGTPIDHDPILLSSPVLHPGIGLPPGDFSPLEKKPSLRQRVSLRTKPPQAIRIPPRVPSSPPHQESHRESSGSGTLRSSTPPTGNSMAHDSAYGSEIGSPRVRRIPRVGSHSDLPSRPPLMPSGHSEQQFYRPVRASPHSPLQQRPHTAAGPSSRRTSRQQSGSFHGHVRQQPSRLGGMSTLSTVTAATHGDHEDDARTMRTMRTTAANTQAGDKTLKKKKSAFGWFKKAFSLDEDERAAFESRKTMQYDEKYYSAKSPKFLDGKRLR